jgi:hypothetical protein
VSFIPISALTQTASAPLTAVIPIVSSATTESINVSALVASSATNAGDTTFYQSGWYLSPKGNFNASYITPVLNLLQAIPFVCTRNVQIQSISMFTATSSVSGTMTLGIYGSANPNYTAGSLMLNCGTISTSVSGFITATFAPFQMMAGITYWISYVQQLQTTPSLTGSNGYSIYSIPYSSQITAGTIFGAQQSGVSGSLPTTFARNGGVPTYPLFWLQYV